MLRYLLALPLAAAVLLITAAGTLAATPTAGLTVTASFAGVNGASPAYCGGAGQPTCTTPPPVQVRWGVAANSPTDPRSGLGFGDTATSTSLNANFVLGTLTHFNWPILGNSAASLATLAVQVVAHTAADGDVTFHLSFPLGIEETANSGSVANCKYPSTTACADAISLPGGSANTGTATVGGHTYTLNVLGFSSSPASTTPQSLLITQEGQDNDGYLIASLSRNNVAPVAVADTASTTSGHATTIAPAANDTDADHDAVSVASVSPPGHGTAVLNADGTVTYTADASFAGTDTFTYVATDGIASSTPATVTVAVADKTPPVLTLPGDLTLEATSAAGAVATYTATATDNVTTAVTPSCAPASGGTFPLGVTTVHCTAADGAGNTASGDFTVTVRDTTAPTLGAVPADIVREATGPAGAAVTYAAPTATDTVDPAPAVTCTPASGATFPLGDTAVSCTARDAAGNVSDARVFHVTVRDTTAPSLTVPAGIAVDATSLAGAVVTFATTATDAVDASPSVVCTPPSGSTFAAGTTTVSCTATDASGNAATRTFLVTVRGVEEQVDALCVSGPGASLCAKATAIKQAVHAGDTATACSRLAAYANEVRAQRGKKLTAAQADDLLARAARIGSLLGC